MLLDTHAFFWLVMGQPLKMPGRGRIAEALGEARLLVSAVTAWELGNLARVGRLSLRLSPTTWFDEALLRSGVTAIDLSPSVAFAAAELPHWDHRDPADRLLVATARILGVPLATRDRMILAYAAAGHVRAVAC